MAHITIKSQTEIEGGWKFVVEVGTREYSVTLKKEYWQKLTTDGKRPEELVKKSFAFLLKREPEDSILREFDLQDISKYFPEYEKEISRNN